MNEVKKKYMDVFFGMLSDATKDSIYFDAFMWHGFSYGAVDSLYGLEAIGALRERPLNHVYIIFQFSDDVVEKENLTVDGLLAFIKEDCRSRADCYIVDSDFKWTFVSTHETYIKDIFCYYDDEHREIREEDLGHAPNIGPFFAIAGSRADS